MKSRLIYLITALLVVVCAVTFAAVGGDGNARVLQHETPLPEGETREDDTHLPIVRVNTNGAPIPHVDNDGKPLDGLPEGTPLDTPCIVETVSKEGAWHSESDAADLSAPATIRIRGNSSRHFDKKSYLLKLKNGNGDDADYAVMGMSSASEWVLNGPFVDRTMMRNYLCYSVAGQTMDYAPNMCYCRLYLNGEYRGLYLMTEAVTKDEGRIDLTEPEKGRAITSWLIRWDRDGKGDTPLENYTHYTYQSGVSGLDLRYPGKNTLTAERKAYVEAELNEIERAIYSTDRSDPVKGYASYLDTSEFAKYFVINEFFGNVDAGRFSTFYYKDMRGKVKPCVWDFNNACDNYIDYVYDDSGFNMVQSPWFGQLLKDRNFVDAVIYEYRTMRKGVLSDSYLEAFLDDTREYLGAEIDRNYEVWGYVFEATAADDTNYLHPFERNYGSYDEAVAQLKSWMKARGAWMDAHIETLRQYCSDSKNAAQAAE